MALLAEALVEEWLNRQGFFTIRGSRSGNAEIDLLAVRHAPGGSPDAFHVEVQVSFRPVGYISRPSKNLRKALAIGTGAATRTPAQVAACANDWARRKFSDPPKVAIRDSGWPGLAWRFALVHGVVKDQDELSAIAQNGVRLIDFDGVLASLVRDGPAGGAAAGGDMAALLYRAAKHASGSPAATL